MSVEEKRIREFAYQIWESEGRPEGQEQRHWDMARKLAEAEALAPKVTPRKPAKAPPASTSKAKPAGATAAPKKPRAAKKPPVA
ncbi:DUF2934 domain-containing protein [Pseudomonas sp. SBB6]|uniref:DUF2934 domain-containing protein n=1 Tax=Pseudomonas sp. SBB6 TaxID=2962032 RepID=UPI0020B82C4A|nr:DUF2934 domain-containing protein [Pseudomonas sp. SBB6]MCP3751985.1 DUF2934 domain-containing protein [Pseudomonas sp. SBB6]